MLTSIVQLFTISYISLHLLMISYSSSQHFHNSYRSVQFLQLLTFSCSLQLHLIAKKTRPKFLVGMRQDTILAWNKHPFSRHRWSFMLGFFYHLSTLSHSLQLQMLMLYHRIVQNILSIMLSILMKLLVFYKTLHSHWKTSLPSKQGE